MTKELEEKKEKEEKTKEIKNNTMKNLKPYFTAAMKSGVRPERNGLPSQQQISKSVYSKCGKNKK